MKRILVAPLLFLIVVLMFSSIGSVRAQGDPNLSEIFNHLGFTNIVESSLQTFIPGTYNATLYAEFADYQSQNELSWYKQGTDLYGVIFYGPEGNLGYVNPPLNKSFTADSEFGLSLISPVSRYFTETARNPNHAKHAVVYENLNDPGMYLVGWENGGGEFDYNDMVLSIKLFRPKTVNVNGLDWYHMTYNRDRIVLALFGGYPYLVTYGGSSWVTVNPLFCQQEYRPPKMRFALDLIANGFDILTNTGVPRYSPSYSGNENWVKDAAEWARNQGYKDVYLFGFSAGAVVVAYEIQREHSTMDFSAAVFACGPVNWGSYLGAVIHSAQTASNDKVSTCFIEPVDDIEDFYDQMRLYYNNTMTHKIWYDWWGGHDIFYNTSKDYPGLTVAQACVNWYNAAHPPNTPKMPSGPAIAYKNYQASYSTATIDPNRDKVLYKFDWGDGSYDFTGLVQCGSTVNMGHTWTSTGTYYVKVSAKDEGGLWSYQSPQIQVTVNILYVTLTLSVPQAPAQGYDTDGTPREPVSIWVDGAKHTFFANQIAYVPVTAGTPHNIIAQYSFLKEEWKPGYYYIYRFSYWNDGVTSNTRTINISSDLTLVAYYLRSKYAIP